MNENETTQCDMAKTAKQNLNSFLPLLLCVCLFVVSVCLFVCCVCHSKTETAYIMYSCMEVGSRMCVDLTVSSFDCLRE